MCFQIIPLCPGCEEPSGLGEEIIYAEDVCSGHCSGDDVVGTTTRLMTRYEADHYFAASLDKSSSKSGDAGGSRGRSFECLTPGCDGHAADERPSIDQEEQMVQGARDHAKVFLREKYDNCLSLCILPFVEAPMGPALSIQIPFDSGGLSPLPTTHQYTAKPTGKPVSRRGVRQERPWSKKRGKPWGPDEEAILWKLRRVGMEFDAIADQIDRTERGCYDRYNKLRNEGYGRSNI